MNYRKLASIYYENKNKHQVLYESRFNSESTYRFDVNIGEMMGFMVITPNILDKIDEIRRLDKKLSDLIAKIPDIALQQYTRRCLIDEIRMTNDIEGVVSTRKEIKEILNDISGKRKNQRLYGLVKKYELLLEERIELQSCEDISALYDVLVLREVIDEEKLHAPDGKIFRKEKVYVKSPSGKTIHMGLYPEDIIIKEMEASLKIISDDKYNKLISIAIFHYMFGYIHPYYDGNGRTSRFISSYLLASELQPLVSYRISHTIKANINMYYKSFKITNDPYNNGELTHFVLDFFTILISSLNELNLTIEEKGKQLVHFSRLIKIQEENDNRALAVLNMLLQNTLFGENGLDVAQICKETKIGNSKVRNVIKKYESLEFLRVEKQGKKKTYDIDLQKLNSI